MRRFDVFVAVPEVLALASGCAASSEDPASTPAPPRSANGIASASGSPVVRAAPSVTASASSPTSEPEESLDARLARASVIDGDVARTTLWTWTTLEQGRAILAGDPVLSKERSDRYGPSAFDWELSDATKKNDRLARLLFSTGFAKKRFAWVNTFAAATGGGGERYGTVLMRVDLRPDALVLDYTRRTVWTASGEKLPIAELHRAPARLAAVYWEGPGFREYVLVNESQIAEVLVADADVIKAFMEERAMVSALLQRARHAPAADAAQTLSRFSMALAFGGASDVQTLETLDTALASVGIDGLDGRVTPKAKLVLGPTRPSLRDECKLVDSRDISYRRRICQPSIRCTMTDDKKRCEPTRRRGIGDE